MQPDLTMTRFAGRLVPARPDLAAAQLRGAVEAERFATGVRRTVTATLLDLTLTADRSAGLATQLLFGESFVVYETRADGYAWGQAVTDGYVGYVAASGLGAARPAGQRITALWSHLYPRPEIRSRAESGLPFLAEVSVSGTTGAFARLREGMHVPRAHLEPVQGDAAATAARFVGMPYLWGGRSARGLDCSALVQLALLSVGVSAPRDTDMQEVYIGAPLAGDDVLARGDLVFWKGHVGLMLDADTLIHANSHHMAVEIEPLAEARRRIKAAGGGDMLARRRLDARNVRSS